MTSLRVVVRIRPFQPHDKEPSTSTPAVTEKQRNKSSECDQSKFGSVLTINGRDMEFDTVLPPTASQNDVYLNVAYPLIEKVLEGTNVCVFAFGNTGAGKSYSMLGPEGGHLKASTTSSHLTNGILPRLASDLFRRIARMESETKAIQMELQQESDDISGELCAYQVRAQFLEVYQGNVFDLLSDHLSHDRDPSCSLPLREDSSSGTMPRVYAQNATEVKVTSMEQLMGLVKRGANARSTCATGAHAHSSRSHALLLLNVERRWREIHGGKKVYTRTASFTLIDLAGAESMDASHGGKVDKAGTATNLGLLVLGRVISALAVNSSGGGGAGHVPYRDSSLTRLMQSSLSGSAQTVMLACVSPSKKEMNFTFKNLQYALSARNVSLAPKREKYILETMEKDPMYGDSPDEDEFLDRRCIRIECGTYGDVFARCVGSADDPLILYIHGSGTTNSSMVWNICASDVQLQAKSSSDLRGFFQVAIDCPGYGRSTNGSKQTVRSYPSQLISSLITALGRRSAACVVGSSQGAAAALNAALELPDIIERVAVCHPVCHAPLDRFCRLVQPILMVFDVTDEGHPVSVGRTLRKYILHNKTNTNIAQECRYFEFDSSVPQWLELNFAKELFSLLSTTKRKDLNKKLLGGRRVEKLPQLVTISGGIKSWMERCNGEILPWYRTNENEKEEEINQQLEISDQSTVCEDPDTIWRTQLDPKTSLIFYTKLSTGQRTDVRPKFGNIIAKQADNLAIDLENSNISNKQNDYLFAEESDSDAESEDEKKERVGREKRDQQLREESQNNCDLCKKILHFPGDGARSLRLLKCRCALCACCVERTVKYTRQCPHCGDSPLQTDSKGVVMAAIMEQDESMFLDDESTLQQSCYWRRLQNENNESIRVVLEYGNTAKQSGGRTSYTTFVKVISKDKASCPGGKLDVQKVDFNINPGYTKPTASIRRDDKRRPNDDDTGYNAKSRRFSFEYTMGRRYPCFMTIHLESWCNISIPYHVQECTSVFKRRIIIQIPKSSSNPRRPKSIDLNGFPSLGETRSEWTNVWIRFTLSGEFDVEYLPEGNRGEDLSGHYGQLCKM